MSQGCIKSLFKRRQMASRDFIGRTLLSTLMLVSTGNTRGAEEVINFNIPEQAIGTALLEFAQQSRMSILFPGGMFNGIRANQLNGVHDLADALDILLRGTGITFTIISQDRQVIVRLGETAAISESEQVLLSEAETSDGQVPVALQESTLLSSQQPRSRRTRTNIVEEINITGSRIRQSSGMTTAVPVTVVNREELRGFAPASTIAEQLDTLPQFFQTQTAQRGGTTFLDASGSFLNLRGMGSRRTLVLFDGSRTVPADRQGAVNVDNFPTALISTVDVVTGGASAAYGADALAGVVNFVIDREFEGVRSYLGTGITEMGDGANRQFSVAAGKQLDQDTHLIASAEMRNINQIYRTPQSLGNWNSIGWVTNPEWFPGAPVGIPQRLTLPNVHSTMHTPAGMINQPGFSLDRHTFTEDGSSVRPFIQGDVYSWQNPGATNTQSGGGEAHNAERAFDGGPSGNEVEQHSTFFGIKHDLNSDLSIYGQAMYGKTASNTRGVRGNPHLQDSWHGTIYVDNPFLPDEVRQAMIAEGLESFRFDKLGQLRGPQYNNWVDERDTSDTSRMWSFSSGFNLRLHDMDLRGSMQRGKSRVRSEGFNMQRIDKLFLALDAVRDPETGAIVCNVQLYNPSPEQLAASVEGKLFLTTSPSVYTLVDSPIGPDNVIRDCSPLNPFGHGNASRQAAEYIGQDKRDNRRLNQDFAELLMSGKLHEGFGAGALDFALGLTYRNEHFGQYSTPAELEREPGIAPELGIRGIAPGIFGASRGLVQFSNNDSRTGAFHVTEAFSELNIPVIESSSQERFLATNLAYRSSRYSSSGQINSWKMGIDIGLDPRLRFRLTRSRDVREPTFSEQFVTVGGGGTLIDPQLDNASVTTTVQSGGNTSLAPEQANTTTAGLVFQPVPGSFLDGFSMALDWYDIDLFGAIGSLGAQRLVDECHYHNIYCDLITRDPKTQIIQRVINSNLNVAAARTWGVDLEVQYAALPNLFQGQTEALNLRLLAGYLGENSTTPLSGSRQDAAGGLNRPRLTAIFMANYQAGPYGLRIQQRYYDSTLVNVNWREGVDVDRNTIASQSVTNLGLSYAGNLARGGEWRLNLDINNLFDRDPPIVPSISQRGGSQAVSNNFDVFGRRYLLGLSLGF